MGRPPRAMQFVRLERGCLVCLTHKPNQDGYLRKAWGNQRSGDRHAEMFHRVIYRAHKGEIPKGHEVDHTCGVRLCCNPHHLRTLSRPTHLRLTNRNRYADRKIQAELHWRTHGGTATALDKIFGVSWSSACRWVREWKSET